MSLNVVMLWCGIAAVPPVVPVRTDVPDVAEVAPPPHAPYPPAAITAIRNGYQVALDRRTADLFQDTLARTDEKDVAAALRKMAKDRKDAVPSDADTAATLEMVAFVVSSQLPGFKKALHDNMGTHGVVITVTGLQAPAIKFKRPRPRLERALQAVRQAEPLMPDEARGAVEAMRAVATTTPLFWKVEARD
jgi:hypothetical protein